MRTAVILAKPHGEKTWVLVRGPEIDVFSQKETFRGMKSAEAHPKYAEAQFWTSDGGYESYTDFETPAQFKARQDAKTQAEEAKANAVAESNKPKIPKPAK